MRVVFLVLVLVLAVPALKELRPLAEQGLAVAQYNLGVTYWHGRGVTQDYAEAAKWYRLAAEQGNINAMNNIGIMYNIGEGVPQDYVRAHVWYNIAAARLPPGEDRDMAVRVPGDSVLIGAPVISGSPTSVRRPGRK